VPVPVPEAAFHWLTLSCLPGFGPVTLCRLGRRYPDPSRLLTADRRPDDFPPRLWALLKDDAALARARDQARRQLARAGRRGIGLVSLGDDRYPPLLREIRDAPPLLFFLGDIHLLREPSVALVGSRSASAYGRERAFALARDLAEAGVSVVSGMALGIDGQAHAGALEAGGKTVAVLGCGVDVVYPRRHARLYERIAEQGVLISEYPCGTRPDGFRFPARNRIIAGLCRGVVVVEATRKSGSLITARLALDQGREVMAVPGRIDSSRSDGCHRLIQEGAFLVRNGGDVLSFLEIGERDVDLAGQEKAAGDLPELPQGAAGILACLDVYPVDVDTLVRRTGLAPGVVLENLLYLELQGLVRGYPGRMYGLLGDGNDPGVREKDGQA